MEYPSGFEDTLMQLAEAIDARDQELSLALAQKAKAILENVEGRPSEIMAELLAKTCRGDYSA